VRRTSKAAALEHSWCSLLALHCSSLFAESPPLRSCKTQISAETAQRQRCRLLFVLLAAECAQPFAAHYFASSPARSVPEWIVIRIGARGSGSDGMAFVNYRHRAHGRM